MTSELTHEFFDGALVDVSDGVLDVSDGVWVVDHSHMYLPPAVPYPHPLLSSPDKEPEDDPIPIITSPDQVPFTESERNLARSENHPPIAYNLETLISQPRDPMDYFERFGVQFQPRFDASNAQEYMDNFHRVFGEDTPFFMDAAEREILREAQVLREAQENAFDNMETLDKPISDSISIPRGEFQSSREVDLEASKPLLNDQIRRSSKKKFYSDAPIANMWHADIPPSLSYIQEFIEMDGWKCNCTILFESRFASIQEALRELETQQSNINGVREFIGRIRDFKGIFRLAYSVTEGKIIKTIYLWEYLPRFTMICRNSFHINCIRLVIHQ